MRPGRPVDTRDRVWLREDSQPPWLLPCFHPALAKTLAPSAVLDVWAQEEPTPGRGNLIIRSRLNPGKNKAGVRKNGSLRSPGPSAHRTRLSQCFSLRCFSQGRFNTKWPPGWYLWPPSQAAHGTHPQPAACLAPGTPFLNPASLPGSATPGSARVGCSISPWGFNEHKAFSWLRLPGGRSRRKV